MICVYCIEVNASYNCIVGVQLAGGCMSAEHAGTRRWGSMLAHAKVPPPFHPFPPTICVDRIKV